jgi:sterol desaturase/sphingolipid hydroxylase (fatty acid hydroxylase superfamily)
MSINPIVLSIPVYFILIAIEWTYDLIANSKKYRLADAITNIGCGIVEQVTGVFISVSLFAAYYFIYENFRVFTIAQTWYWYIVLFLAVDFCYYWAHRLSHEINLFWIGHVVHHQSEDYNLSVALRQGALQKVFTTPFYWPLALLGFDPLWFLFTSAWVTLYQFWIHTEHIGRMGWFEYIFNTPSHHRVHHGRNPEYIDKNHAGMLIIWDKMFGTFEPEQEKVVYGITQNTHSFNALDATWIPIKELATQFAQVKGFGNKVKFLAFSPGWAFNHLQKTAPPLSAPKYATQNTPLTNGYILVMFLVIIGFTAYFLFNAKTLTTNYQLFLATYVLSALLGIGLLNNKNRWAWYFELFRHLLFLGFYFYVFHIS